MGLVWTDRGGNRADDARAIVWGDLPFCEDPTAIRADDAGFAPIWYVEPGPTGPRTLIELPGCDPAGLDLFRKGAKLEVSGIGMHRFMGEIPLCKEAADHGFDAVLRDGLLEIVPKTPSAPPSEEAARLGEELERARAASEAYAKLANDLQGDIERLRTRVVVEVDAKAEREVRDLVSALAPALEGLYRAAAGLKGRKDDPYAEGAALAVDDLMARLAEAGVISFTPLGEPFDPGRHEAVRSTAKGKGKARTVVEVVAPGWTYKGKLVRPARVVVG